MPLEEKGLPLVDNYLLLLPIVYNFTPSRNNDEANH